MPPDQQRLSPSADESLDLLSQQRRVLQRRNGHRSATDDLVAAWVGARALPSAALVLDLGCGHGTVTLHLTELLSEARFVGVEVNPVSADLARRNMKLNGLSDRVQIVESDLRSLLSPQGWLAEGSFDLVTGTPPFMPLGSGVLSRDPQRRAARFELHGGIEDYCLAAARYLAPGGRVSMVMDASQDERVRLAFTQAELEIECVVRVVPRVGKGPRYRAYLARAAASTDVALHRSEREEQLVIRDEAGAYTSQMLDLRDFLGLPPAGERS